MTKQFMVCLGLVLLFYTGLVHGQALIDALRGPVALEETNFEPELHYWQHDRRPIPRDYVQQPPLIPHKIEGYTINLNYNKCLACHSWANYQKFSATKISQTHFEDREKSVLANVAARRYFCIQCHVPQTDAQPLVGNTFKPVAIIKQLY